MTEIIKSHGIEIEVRRKKRIRIARLEVERNGELAVIVPSSFKTNEIEKLLSKKKDWIYSTLKKKQKVLSLTQKKEFIPGEGFYYLGKKYRLKLYESEDKQSKEPTLKLKSGRFLLLRNESKNGFDHFKHWYSEQAKKWVPLQVENLKRRVGVFSNKINVRDLGYRWGSCTPKKNINFHWKIMMLPPKIARHLILHELVHTMEPKHDRNFYALLKQVDPDYEEKQLWLDTNAHNYTL